MLRVQPSENPLEPEVVSQWDKISFGTETFDSNYRDNRVIITPFVKFLLDFNTSLTSKAEQSRKLVFKTELEGASDWINEISNYLKSNADVKSISKNFHQAQFELAQKLMNILKG